MGKRILTLAACLVISVLIVIGVPILMNDSAFNNSKIFQGLKHDAFTSRRNSHDTSADKRKEQTKTYSMLSGYFLFSSVIME